MMTSMIFREQLHKQIDELPDDIVQQIANFTLFITAKKKITPSYVDWSDDEWQEFSLAQFFRDDEEDEVLYTREDAIKVYH